MGETPHGSGRLVYTKGRLEKEIRQKRDQTKKVDAFAQGRKQQRHGLRFTLPSARHCVLDSAVTRFIKRKREIL
jgi:hypothetical protein